MNRFSRLLAVAAAVLLFVCGVCALTTPPTAPVTGFPPALPAADLILRNGVIVTLDPLQPKVQALAVRDGRIQALGSDAAIAHYRGPRTRILDLHGAFVTPGFIEGHGHLLATGASLMELPLGRAPNWAGIVAMVRAAAAKARPGEWVVGAGWQQSKWNRVPQPNVAGLPLPASLDAAAPHNPVLLVHASGHAIFANGLALKLAGISRQTPNPPGGSIVRDARGNAIGMLRDTAAAPVYAAYHRYLRALPAAVRHARRRRALELAIHNEISKGITTFVDMGENFVTVDWLRRQAARGLPLRLDVNINGEPVSALAAHLPQYRALGLYDDHFTVRGVGEILSDGALGTRSAWFLKPYTDAPSLTGKNVTPMTTIRQIAEIAARDHFQLSVHAIGDRANRETLDVFQQIFTADPAAHALRWRIEHAQHLNPADIPRFAQLGVIASMQSIHACSDAPFVVARIGERRAREGAYVWQSLIATGALLGEGTDTPVEDTNPIPNFYCAITRREADGRAFFPDQAKTRMEELRDYTWNNAYAILQERQLGSLAPGKRADMDVFSADLLAIRARDILRTRVLYTIVGGEIVYQRPGAAQWHPGQVFPKTPEFDHVN